MKDTCIIIDPLRINFTPEFKRVAYDQLTNGKSIREILEEHGIDPEILGESRLYGIAYKLRQNADRDEGFTNLRAQNSRKPPKETREQTLAVRVEQLEHELAYTRQEVEFLKKFIRQIWRRGSYGNPSSARSKICPDP